MHNSEEKKRGLVLMQCSISLLRSVYLFLSVWSCSSSPDLPLQILDTDFVVGLLVVVEPLSIVQFHLLKLCAGIEAVCQPRSLYSPSQ